MTKHLTQAGLDAAKPKRSRYDMPDGLVPGLQFAIHPTGRKTSRLLSRVHGKLKSFPIGDVALMTLAEARAKARRILVAIGDGEDPSETKRIAVRASSETVKTVAEDFIARYAKPKNRTWAEAERLIARNILPVWGKRPIASIDGRDVNALMDSIVDRGSRVAANRVHTAGSKMFKWARSRHLIASSPFESVEKPTQEKARDRTPSDSELALILCAADTLGYPFGPYFRLLAFTGQRREEIAGLRRSELSSDLALWTLPRERAKNDIQHTVPLAPQVREMIAALPRFEGPDLLFTTNGRTAISGFSKAKNQLDAAIAELNGGGPIPPWRIHDLRRAMASGMAKMGVQMPVVEKILNHVSGSFAGVAGIYQRHDFADEKKLALELWARHLATIVDGAPAATNVVELARARV
jgi:integrase